MIHLPGGLVFGGRRYQSIPASIQARIVKPGNKYLRAALFGCFGINVTDYHEELIRPQPSASS
jgi:transposase